MPTVGATAIENMLAFVRYCREKLTVFGSDLDFDQASWDVTDRYWKRGHGRTFVNFTQNSSHKGFIGEPFVEPFASQCKAYIRYRAAFDNNKSMNYTFIAAMRELYTAFINRDMVPDLCMIDSRLLDEAVALGRSRKPGNYAPALGTELGKFIRFIRDKRLSATVPVNWKHGERWGNGSVRIGPAADQRRAYSMN